MKRHLFVVLYFSVLVLFTGYVLLDTFVIPRAYLQQEADGQAALSGRDSADAGGTGTGAGNAADTNTDAGPGSGANTDAETNAAAGSNTAVVTDTSYADEHIQISISRYRESDTTVYVADITLSSAEYLKTALAQNAYGKNITEKTSEMAENHDAILAINGDYYGVQEKGYVLRNGILYRDRAARGREDLVIYGDGSFEIIEESEVSAAALLENGAMQILSFGPSLVESGEITVSQNDEVGKAMVSNPRTAIALVSDLHYLFLVSDGRTRESEGLTLYELASFARGLGAQTVYNLDGGGSSTLWFNGNVINRPTTSGKIKERSVSDIVYIGY